MPLSTSCFAQKMHIRMLSMSVIPHRTKEAKKMLPEEVQEDQAFYPSDDTLKNLEVYEQLGKKWLGVYNDLYLQVKMYRK